MDGKFDMPGTDGLANVSLNLNIYRLDRHFSKPYKYDQIYIKMVQMWTFSLNLYRRQHNFSYFSKNVRATSTDLRKCLDESDFGANLAVF